MLSDKIPEACPKGEAGASDVNIQRVRARFTLVSRTYAPRCLPFLDAPVFHAHMFVGRHSDLRRECRCATSMKGRWAFRTGETLSGEREGHWVRNLLGLRTT